jgi:hypothetical protein
MIQSDEIPGGSCKRSLIDSDMSLHCIYCLVLARELSVPSTTPIISHKPIFLRSDCGIASNSMTADCGLLD